MGRCRSCEAIPCLRAISIWLALGLFSSISAQVVETSKSTDQSENSGGGALLFSPAAAPLPADETPTGGGMISGLFGKNEAPFQYAIHLTLRGAYDDNIALTHLDRMDDYFVEIQPALLVGIGDLVRQNTFLAVMYLPSFFRYDEHSEFNSDQHVVHVLGGLTPTDKITLRMSEDIAIRENIVLAATSQERSGLGTTNGRTDLGTFATRLSLNYNMTPSDFLFSELKANMTEYAAPLISSELYGGDLYLNHGFTQQLVLGMGVEAGFNRVDSQTPDQQTVQTNAHLNFTPNTHFTIDIIAGEEFRTFENHARGTYDTPVFLISSSWAPDENLKISATASRQIFNSAAATAQDYVDTSFNGLLREHIFKPVYVTVLGGWEHVEYFNAIDAPMPLPTLTTDYFYWQPSLDIVFTRWWIFGGYYLRRQNTGSVETVDFKSNEFGVRTTIKF